MAESTAMTEQEKAEQQMETKFFEGLKSNCKKKFNEETDEEYFPFQLKDYFAEKEISQNAQRKLKDMADPKAPSGLRPIHYAALFDDLETLQHLYDIQADLTLKNDMQSNALHLACCAGAVEVIPTLVKYLKNKVEDVNVIGNGYLHCAVLSDNLETVRVLVECLQKECPNMFDIKAEVRKPNNCSQTPGTYANGKDELEAYLIEVEQGNTI